MTKTRNPGKEETALDSKSAGKLKRKTVIVSMLNQRHTVVPHHPLYTNILSDTTNNTQKIKGESWPGTSRKSTRYSEDCGRPSKYYGEWLMRATWAELLCIAFQHRPDCISDPWSVSGKFTIGSYNSYTRQTIRDERGHYR